MRSLSMKIKRAKNPQAHSDPKLTGMGDNYGTGVKAKIGKVRDSYIPQIKRVKSKVKNPPKSLA